MKTSRFRLLSAVHLFLFDGEKVLLLRRFNTGYEDGRYSVVAGHLDGGEQIIDAAIREAREEAGILITPEDLEVIGVMHRQSEHERIDWFLAAYQWTGSITNAEPDKCDHLAWFSPESLPENTIPYVKKALENYRQGRWFDSFGWQNT